MAEVMGGVGVIRPASVGVGAQILGVRTWREEVVGGAAGGKVKSVAVVVVVGGRMGGRAVRGVGVRAVVGASCSLSRSRLCFVRRFWYHTFTCNNNNNTPSVRVCLSLSFLYQYVCHFSLRMSNVV